MSIWDSLGLSLAKIARCNLNAHRYNCDTRSSLSFSSRGFESTSRRVNRSRVGVIVTCVPNRGVQQISWLAGVESFAGTRIQTRDRPPAYRLVSARSLLEDSITSGDGRRDGRPWSHFLSSNSYTAKPSHRRPGETTNSRLCFICLFENARSRARAHARQAMEKGKRRRVGVGRGGGKREEKGYSMAGALLDRARFKVDGMDRCKSPRARARVCVHACICARARR